MLERNKKGGLRYRAVTLRADSPDRDSGPMRWILTTEMPTRVYDWERDAIVEEVLLADGMRAPKCGQVPLLDCHSRWSVEDLIGHVEGFSTSDVDGYGAVAGDVYYCSDEKSQRTEAKVRENHLTDGSVGYVVTKSIYIPEGETAAVSGRTFEGPLRVGYEWYLKEFSLTPIGADSLAKVAAA